MNLDIQDILLFLLVGFSAFAFIGVFMYIIISKYLSNLKKHQEIKDDEFTSESYKMKKYDSLMKVIICLVFLLLLPIVSAEEITFIKQIEFQKTPMSYECQEQYKEAFDKDVSEVLKEYCDDVSSNSFWVLGLSIVILLVQPLVKKKNEFIGGAVKLLGLGLIALVMIMLYFRM